MTHKKIDTFPSKCTVIGNCKLDQYNEHQIHIVVSYIYIAKPYKTQLILTSICKTGNYAINCKIMISTTNEALKLSLTYSRLSQIYLIYI